MDRAEIEQHLEYLAEMEFRNLKDNMLEIQHYVSEYKDKYGLTPFIMEFVSDYIDQRNLYYSEKRFSHK